MQAGDESKRKAMMEKNQRLNREREEIAARVADFKAIQEKFKREREEYCTTMLENARTPRQFARPGARLERVGSLRNSIESARSPR
jgi:hypothetical protein